MIYKNIIRGLTLLIIGVMFSTQFYFLSLNTFLAYIPLELSFHIDKVNNQVAQSVMTAFWLLFFPNIPYLVTDIVHSDMLSLYNYADGTSLPSVRLWALLIILFLVIFAYNLWGFAELLKMAKYFSVKFHLKRWGTYAFIAVVCFLSSMGMYAGRFPPRLHSIYFLTDPWKVIDIIFIQWSMKKLEFVMLFFLLHLGILIIIFLHDHIMEENKSRIRL